MPRESQEGKDVRVFCFKLDRRKDDEAHVRKQIEAAMSRGLDLKSLIMEWMNGEDKIFIVEDTSVELQVSRALEGFEYRLVELLMKTPTESIRQYVDERKDTDEIGGAKLTEDFVNGMMRGFHR